MEFLNIKTCHGLESYLKIDGALVRLSELPEVVRHLTDEQLRKLLNQVSGRRMTTAA